MATKITLGRLNNPRQMSEVEAAYWAAMLDGEGSICITRARMPDQRPQYRLVVSIANTNFGLLDTLAGMVGVGTLQRGLRNHERWKDGGMLVLNHEAADFVLRQVMPFLVAKRAQAEIALKFMELKRSWSRSNDNYEAQAALREENRTLNARGKANQKHYDFTEPSTEKRTCTYDGCSAVHYGNGYCRRHYRWIYESKAWSEATTRNCEGCGTALAPNLKLTAKFCSVSCKMKFHRRQGCYSAENLASAPKCSVDDCGRPRQAQGLCRRHYMQKWHAQQKAAAAP